MQCHIIYITLSCPIPGPPPQKICSFPLGDHCSPLPTAPRATESATVRHTFITDINTASSHSHRHLMNQKTSYLICEYLTQHSVILCKMTSTHKNCPPHNRQATARVRKYKFIQHKLKNQLNEKWEKCVYQSYSMSSMTFTLTLTK